MAFIKPFQRLRNKAKNDPPKAVLTLVKIRFRSGRDRASTKRVSKENLSCPFTGNFTEDDALSGHQCLKWWNAKWKGLKLLP